MSLVDRQNRHSINMTNSTPNLPYQLDQRRGSTHETLLSLIPRGSTVLDLGCAIGYLGGELRRVGCDVYGVDANPLAIDAAASQGYTALELLDLNNFDQLPFGGKKFDVVLAADVLEHLLEPDQLLIRLHELVAPGGNLLISVPNIAHGSVRLSLLTGRFDYVEVGILDRTHLHFYTFKSARMLLERTGWTVDATYCGAAKTGRWLNRSKVGSLLLRGILSTGIIVMAT